MKTSPWLTTEPPKDGTPIVAFWRIIWHDEIITAAEPFLGQIEWKKDESNWEGWHFASGMSVARCLDDEVIIDYWVPLPRKE